MLLTRPEGLDVPAKGVSGAVSGTEGGANVGTYGVKLHNSKILCFTTKMTES